MQFSGRVYSQSRATQAAHHAHRDPHQIFPVSPRRSVPPRLRGYPSRFCVCARSRKGTVSAGIGFQPDAQPATAHSRIESAEATARRSHSYTAMWPVGTEHQSFLVPVGIDSFEQRHRLSGKPENVAKTVGKVLTTLKVRLP